MRKLIILVIFLYLLCEVIGCTLGVINGSATADGRPIIWKSREAGTNVQVLYNNAFIYEYTGSGNSGSEYVWMGMNEAGLAIGNALSGDLTRLPGNGDCMLQALRNYSTIDEFLTFLDSTNVSGRETHTNYVMMDATGAAVVLEVGTTEYWLYDTADTEYGFLVRDNFSIAGGGTSTVRYALMNSVLTDLAQAGPIAWEDIFPLIIRDFYDEDQNPVALPFEDRWNIDSPYGYIPTSYSNCGLSFSSSALMHGSASGEPAWLSTMWTILGTPTCGIALPFWAVCPSVPEPARGDPTVPLTDRATQIRQLVYNSYPTNIADSWILRNETGTGYWDTVWSFEEEHFDEINALREQWVGNPPTINQLQTLENEICNDGYQLVMDWEPEFDYQPDFTCEPATGEAPLSVHFDDYTLHSPDSLAWDFEANGIIDSMMTDSLGLGVEWTYIQPGTYSPILYAWHDEILDSLVTEDLITVDFPDVEYLSASLDTVICDLDDPLDEEVTIYNIGDYSLNLQNLYFTELEGFPHPQPELFSWYFIDENLELPLELAAGDSCQLLISPTMPIREYWGEMLVIEADLDTLNLPCLYNEDLWNNGDEDEVAIDPNKLYIRNFPNPFNPSTNISFAIPEAGLVEIAMFNIKGQSVKTLIKEELERGEFSINWQGDDDLDNKCGSGIYFYQLEIDGKIQAMGRCLLLK